MSEMMLSRHEASRACAACQKYKRRCDKTLPSCSLCVRLHRFCDYSNKQGDNHLRTRIQELESLVTSHLGTLSPQSSTSSSRDNDCLPIQAPTTFYPAGLRFQKLFLEPDIHTRPDPAPPPSGDLIPPAVLPHLGDSPQRALIMSRYFQTVHRWMPIVSRIRLGQLTEVESHESRPRADFALLLLSMKLIQQVPQDSSSALRDRLYISTKEFAASLDIAGVYSLLKLQANLLLAVYEMGHGIFPAAYTSMGYCVTQAAALGVHNKDAPRILEPARTWMDWEERQRVWWLIVILDRYVTAAGDNRPLLSADPNTSSHLPADDEAWDAGESVPPERLFLSSSKQLSASPFARLAQAAHLLGEVVKHCNDESQRLVDVQKEVEVLSQATSAFLDILSKDTASIIHLYSAVGVCLSALLKLSDHHACDSFYMYSDRQLDMAEVSLAREVSLQCQDILKHAITAVLSLVEILNETMQSEEAIEGLAPWFLGCIYQAVANLAYLASTAPAQDIAKYASKKAMCVNILRQANKRWKVAGAYLEAIELVEEELRAGQY